MLRKEVEDVNGKSLADLSYKRIYADVKRMMTKPAAEWPDLFVGYCESLSAEIFKNASHKCALAFHGGTWSDAYGKAFSQFSITWATGRARALMTICRKAIDPNSEFEFTPENFRALKEWEISELNRRTEYAET